MHVVTYISIIERIAWRHGAIHRLPHVRFRRDLGLDRARDDFAGPDFARRVRAARRRCRACSTLLKEYGITIFVVHPRTYARNVSRRLRSVSPTPATKSATTAGRTGRPLRSLARRRRKSSRAQTRRSNSLTGRYARGYRSPSWDLSPHSVELLLKHGFVYDSSMMGDDYAPYRVRQGDVIELEKPAVFGTATPLIEMPISWTLDDYPHFEFIRTQRWILPGNMNANLVLGNWIADFLYLEKILEWGVITYTFHPFVIGRGHAC